MATIATASTSCGRCRQAIGGPVPLHARARRLDELAAALRLCLRAVGLLSGRSSRPASSASELHFGDATVRFVDQPHGGTDSLGLRFDEGGHSVGYAIDFSDLTDDMAALYEGVDVWIADCLTRTPHPTHAHLDGVLGWARDLQRRPALSDAHGQRPRLSHAWSPSCPTGRRRPMTGWRSRYDDQRPDARRRLYPDGDHAGARAR